MNLRLEVVRLASMKPHLRPYLIPLLRQASGLRFAGPLRDVSKLRYQAVFMMGAGGSGKGFVSQRWLKYMPGGGETGVPSDLYKERMQQKLTEAERGLTNLKFDALVDSLASKGVHIKPVPGGSASIPFRLTDDSGVVIPVSEWDARLPPQVRSQVEDLSEIVFDAPKHELPSYWRQADPDIFKKEIPGYDSKEPGYVHEMSSDMSKAYLESVLETGDPLFVDGTGSNYGRMTNALKMAKESGYRVSLVYVTVDLTSNQIRNATRDRVVAPLTIVEQWQRIRENYDKLRPLAHKSKKIVNRNDAEDARKYNANPEEVDSIISVRTRGLYSGLRDLIADKSPEELSHWDSLLDWKRPSRIARSFRR